MIWIIIGLGAVAAVFLAYYLLFFEKGSSFDKALALAERGDYTDARGMIRSKLERDPRNPRAHFTMAQIYRMEGSDDNELRHLVDVKKAGRFPPDINAAEVYNRIGELFYLQDRYRDSFENYLESLRFSQNNEDALAHLAFMGIGQGEFEIAERFFKRLIKIAPNSPEYHLARGVGLSMLKNKEALKELEMALALNPNDVTARFMCALQSFKQADYQKAAEMIESLLSISVEPAVSHIINRLATAVYYALKKYDRALTYAERCLTSAASENWDSEEYDARLSIAYMALLGGNLDKANENLLELEIRNPTDDLVMRISDFRMDLEEGITTIDQVSPRGFDFYSQMQDWLRKRFPEESIYNLSGLAMEQTFDVLAFFTRDGTIRPARVVESGFDPGEVIQRFYSLDGPNFMSACENIIALQGFKIEKQLPYRDRDGADFIAYDRSDKKNKALFRIRKWINQPISDIFLRNVQNDLNQLKVNVGFVIAGTRLTPGAEEALVNLKKVTVINEQALGELLLKVLK